VGLRGLEQRWNIRHSRTERVGAQIGEYGIGGVFHHPTPVAGNQSHRD
jgi:hypothetical protein